MIVLACCEAAYKDAVQAVTFVPSFLFSFSLVTCHCVLSDFLRLGIFPPRARAVNARRICPLLNWTTGTTWTRCYL